MAITDSGITANLSLQDYRQRMAFPGIITGAVWATVNIIQGDLAFAAILLALTAVAIGWLLRMTRSSGGPHISHAAAQANAGADDVIVYWRPGCMYCDRLRVGLGSARRDVAWVNIFEDPEAAAFVGSIRGGHHVVPTVVSGAGELVDPTPAAIKGQLATAGA